MTLESSQMSLVSSCTLESSQMSLVSSCTISTVKHGTTSSSILNLLQSSVVLSILSLSSFCWMFSLHSPPLGLWAFFVNFSLDRTLSPSERKSGSSGAISSLGQPSLLSTLSGFDVEMFSLDATSSDLSNALSFLSRP